MDYSNNKDRVVKLLISVTLFAMIGSAIFYSVKRQNSENGEQLAGISGLSSQEISFLTNQGFLPTTQEERNELTVADLKSPTLVEQNLNSSEESFEVLAAKLNRNNKSYQMAFRLENKSDQNKEFYLIPVSKENQLQFKEIKGIIDNKNTISINKDDAKKEPLEQLYNVEKHKKELKPELARAYDDIEDNNYQPSPIKITLTAKSTLLAQSNWQINGDPISVSLEPVYFLVQGSAGGVKDDLIILNVHSSPQQGENWEVSFTTNGTADLTITPNDQATIDDDEFTSLSCGDEERTPQILQGDIIYYPNWECPPSEALAKDGPGEGKVVHYTRKAGKHTLKFQFGDQIAFAYNNPDTETLRPNGAGSETSIPNQYPASTLHWDKVDEETPDEDATYVVADIRDDYWKRDLYALPNHTGSGTINSVTVYARLRATYATPTGKISIRTNNTTYDTSAFAIGTSWANYSNVWATNPQTGLAWTWDEIDALEAGVSLYGSSSSILKGQQVLMADGSQKNIEDVQVGDEIISFDLDSWTIEKDKVIGLKNGPHDDYLVFNGVLKTSLEHRIWASGEFKEAKDIRVGDFLLDPSGNDVAINKIEYVQEKVETYDLIIEKNHNFFASNYLVHNFAPPVPGGDGYCTQVYVVVDYTPAAGGAVRIKGGLQIKGGLKIKF